MRSASPPVRPINLAGNLLSVAPEKRTSNQQAQIRRFYLERIDKHYARLKAELADVSRQKTDLEKSFPVLMVMQEPATPRDTYVLKRGQYDQAGEKVGAGVPGALPPFPDDVPRNRLGLAQWLVHPANPLTARVAVNRWWQMLFGTGLVKTVEDFGATGELPSHPELLDFLATELRPGQVGREGDAEAHRHLVGLSSVLADVPGTAGTRSREPLAGTRITLPASGGDRAGQCPGHQRLAEGDHRRTERQTVSATWIVGRRDGITRGQVRCRSKATISIAGACTRSGSGRVRHRP